MISLDSLLILYHTIQTFNDPEKESFSKNCEKRRNQHFLHCPQCFQKTSFSRSLKSGNVWKRVNPPFFRECIFSTVWASVKPPFCDLHSVLNVFHSKIFKLLLSMTLYLNNVHTNTFFNSFS